MKQKNYKRPAMSVVKLQHNGMLMASTTGNVNATMNDTWTETDI